MMAMVKVRADSRSLTECDVWLPSVNSSVNARHQVQVVNKSKAKGRMCIVWEITKQPRYVHGFRELMSA